MYRISLAAAWIASIASWASAAEPLSAGPLPKGPAAKDGYTVVVAEATRADAQWKPVVEALVAKHHAGVVTYARSIEETLPRLRGELPRYICFVAKPAEVSKEFVAQVCQLTRRLDDDPYTDVLWGILTGYDAACALRIARQTQPLVIRRVAAGLGAVACREGRRLHFRGSATSRPAEFRAGQYQRLAAGRTALRPVLAAPHRGQGRDDSRRGRPGAGGDGQFPLSAQSRQVRSEADVSGRVPRTVRGKVGQALRA